ncbi:ABC transporter ATP-binding protein [Pikeienuella piscinae]|uniref:ABC transporter ATP-binding protein n=1 Tax=Pikeienuella piscinae TaxID=2748098 RepID=A0A7L5BVK3_9RHOB|nr:ABC transporter ATP-binding protein [Pikeienuella piscinae]QIE55123.1 ABC transporter ATP-binding protein [Pikeienuella piscinae]
MSDALLEIRDLRIALDGDSAAEVVKGVSLSIQPGETMCLVGESGSGKSLTALATMGLLPSALKATQGEILLKGENLLAASSSRLRGLRASAMSMIFQEPMTALNPVHRVGEQIAEVLEAHTKLDHRSSRRRVIEMMEEVHLPSPESLYASFPHQLSGGQRQRIMIAMALVLRPQLLIADEPTTALDVTTQKQILALIRELRETTGAAVLFITHDMGVVAEIADNVTVLRLGEVQETRPVGELLRTPRTEYSRQLLRAVPNLTPRAPRPVVDAPTVLETKGLGKVYGAPGWRGKGREVVAAKGVDLSLRQGRTLGIVGESGSGKSTVARCIVRLIDPTEGSIRISGEEIATLGQKALKPHRKRVQIVFQDPFRSLNPRIEVGASITEGPTNFGVPQKEAMKRARELLELVGLPASAVDRFPHQFSGGQRQRIAIARALAMDPDLLVADEAVSALDVSVQSQVLDLLAEIQERLGVGLLFITHDLRVAAQICDDVMVMQKGEVVEYGPAAEVLGAPRNDYTRALIDAAPGRDWDFARFRPVAEAS